MKGFVRFITFLAFIGVVLLGWMFAWKNTTEVTLWFGRDISAVSVGVLVITVFILGAVIGLLLGVGILRQLKTMVEIRKLKNQIARMESAGNSDQTQSMKK